MRRCASPVLCQQLVIRQECKHCTSCVLCQQLAIRHRYKHCASPVLCQGLVVCGNSLWEVVLLHKSVALARQRLCNQLVVSPQLPASLHSLVTVSYACIIVCLLIALWVVNADLGIRNFKNRALYELKLCALKHPPV